MNLDRVVYRNSVGGIVAVIVRGVIQRSVKVARNDIVYDLDIIGFEIVIELVYLLGVDVHFFNGVGYLLGGELSVLLAPFKKLADNFSVAHFLSFPVLLDHSYVHAVTIIPGSP